MKLALEMNQQELTDLRAQEMLAQKEAIERMLALEKTKKITEDTSGQQIESFVITPAMKRGAATHEIVLGKMIPASNK